jgi:hypothetical protein
VLQSSGCVADIQYIARLDADQGFSQGLRSDAGSRSRGILSGMGPRYLPGSDPLGCRRLAWRGTDEVDPTQ